MSEIKQLVQHVDREVYQQYIKFGYECDDLVPCPNQGANGSCFECPGTIKNIPGCGWDFRVNPYGFSKTQLQFYRLVEDNPRLILDLPL